MIISGLLSLVFNVFSFFIGLINIPSIDQSGFDQVSNLVGDLFDGSMDVIGFLLPWGLTKTLLIIIGVIWLFDHVYRLVIWIIRKIPVAAID